MLHQHLHRILIFASLLLSGCAARSVYIPISHNTPLFDSNRQLKTAMYPSVNHIELQAAYNPLPHIAVAGNVNLGDGVKIFDAAIGTYTYNRNARLRYEVFVGYGHNRNIYERYASANSDVHSYLAKASYNKYYLQSAFGFFESIKVYDIKYSFSLSARVSMNYFQTYSYKNADATVIAPNIAEKNYSNSTLYLLEPCFTHKVGYRNIYAILQVQAMMPYSQEIDIRYTKFSPVILCSGGIGYDINFRRR